MSNENPQYDLEVLGTCMTNSTKGSQYDTEVESRYLWSYAQEEALVALSEKSGDGCYRLIKCPERRAKRIAARYADLFFLSESKSGGKLQFYWVALAAFVVKDIVEAYRYARVEVLAGGWRSWDMVKLGGLALTDASPYAHAARTYAALAKGNLWLFMDIYPWLWFFQEYGIKSGGGVHEARLNKCVSERDWNTFQIQSKKAVQELPFGRNWMVRQKRERDADAVYANARKHFQSQPMWTGDASGYYGQHQASAAQAHGHVRQHLPRADVGYHLPIGRYWSSFPEAFYVLEEERKEWQRLHVDGAALGRLEKLRNFKVTPEMQEAYQQLIAQASAKNDAERVKLQQRELVLIARQEQINVLQPLIYDDVVFKQTMDANHAMSRRWGSWVAPPFKVVYSAQPTTNDPKLQTVFDPPTGLWDRVKGTNKSLPNQNDRMEFVNEIAKRFNILMAAESKYRPQLIRDLRTIRGWLNA